MRTIAVIALKGGSGKTTVAVNLALAAHLRDLQAIVVDTDPQGSASEVMRARAGDGPAVVQSSGADLFAAQVASVHAGADLMIVDTAAGAVEEVGQAIVLADLAILVVRPTLLDIAATVRTVQILRRLGKPFAAVLNQAPVARDGVEAPVVKRALRALDFMGLPMAPVFLRARAVYQTAVETGRSAEETPDGVAAGEVARLWTFVHDLAFGLSQEASAADSA